MYSSPAASAPGSMPGSPHTMVSQAGQSPVLPNSRSMQVKVLYSFDDGNKTNCLARCPQSHLIQTAQLDNNTQIGIIELRLCIQAIVSASPELVAKLGQDYTVYAYDYSEYETPLVGQGMLSWVLASSSATPNAPAQSSKTMVTGRVCKNILGLFSNGGSTETLEVKLRLVPVPTCLQSEYLESMQKYRDASISAAERFDGDAWTNFLRANPGFGVSQPLPPQTVPNMDQQPSTNLGDFDFSPEDTTLSVIGQDDLGAQLSPLDQSHDSLLAYDESGTSQAELRPAPAAHRQSRQPPSRTASRASNHSQRSNARHEERPSVQQQTSKNSSEESATMAEPSFVQDGTRKRARIERTDWRGPPAFESRSDSLLRTASAAASIRNQGPQAALQRYPSASDIAAGEIGPRPPTPISKPPRRRPAARSSISGGARPTSSYRTSYTAEQDAIDSASIASSPPQRETSILSAGFDEFPSSPPVVRRNSSSAPLSPSLPPLQHADSGFVSGSIEEYINDGDDEMRPADYEDLKVAARHKSRNRAGLINATKLKSEGSGDKGGNKIVYDLDASLNMEMPGDPNRLPTSSDPRKRPQNDTAAKPKSQPKARAARANSMCKSQEPASDTGSVAPEAKVKSGIKRKRAIEARLRSDIAKGIAPQYCKNCGSIETPTWRKCFVSIVPEVPEDLKVSDEEYGIWCVEPMKDEDRGTIINYALIRRSIRKDEADKWQETQLCNPCGIYLFKSKRMRPKEKLVAEMAKSQVEAADRPKRVRNRKKQTELAGSVEPMSMALESDMDGDLQLPDLPSGRSDRSVAKSSGRVGRLESKAAGRSLQRSASTGGVQAPKPRRTGLDSGAAAAALQRAIQSSPPRFQGSRLSPIELDAAGSPDPTRRLLFPSPRKTGEMKLLDSTEKSDDQSASSGEEPQLDKENMPPEPVQADTDDDGLRHLFSPSGLQSPNASHKSGGVPRTPSSRIKSSPRGVLTDSAKRRHANPETPSRSIQRALGIASPEEMTPWTRQFNNLLSEGNAGNLDSDGFNNIFSDAQNDGAFAFSDFSVADQHGNFDFSLYEDPHGNVPREGGQDNSNNDNGQAAQAESGAYSIPAASVEPDWDLEELLTG